MLKETKASGNGNLAGVITGRSVKDKSNIFPVIVYHNCDGKRIKLTRYKVITDNRHGQYNIKFQVKEGQYWQTFGTLTEDGIFKTVNHGNTEYICSDTCIFLRENLLKILLRHQCKVIQVSVPDDKNGNVCYTCDFVDFLRDSEEMILSDPPLRGLRLAFWHRMHESNSSSKARVLSFANIIEIYNRECMEI